MQRIASSLLLTALVLSVCGCAVLNIFGTSRTIHGVVKRDGKPVAGARVIAGRNTAMTTGEDGAYEYCCFPDSVVTLHVLAGNADATISAVVPESGSLDIPLQTAPGVLPQTAGGILYGEVHDRSGTPIIGAVIRVLGTKNGGFSKRPSGRFTIVRVPLGTCRVEMRAIGYFTLVAEVTVDSTRAQQLLFVAGEDRGGHPMWQLAEPRSAIVRGQAATVRTITFDDLESSPRGSIFGSAP